MTNLAVGFIIGVLFSVLCGALSDHIERGRVIRRLPTMRVVSTEELDWLEREIYDAHQEQKSRVN